MTKELDDVVLINEANAIGIKWIQKVTSRRSIYSLDCGHEVESDRNNVRKGFVPRCEICLIDRYKANAKAINATWLHRINSTRSLYRLSCGHEVNSPMESIRKGWRPVCEICKTQEWKDDALRINHIFVKQYGDGKRAWYICQNGHGVVSFPTNVHLGKIPDCEICMVERRQADAEKVGYKWIAYVSAGVSRYECRNGHSCLGAPDRVALGKAPRCEQCTIDKLNAECAPLDLKLINRVSGGKYAMYQLACGHIEKCSTTHIRRGQYPACSHGCLKPMDQAWIDKSNDSADKLGIVRIRKIDSWYSEYKLSCGHIRPYPTGLVNSGRIPLCDICANEKRQAEANAIGLDWVDDDAPHGYSNYRLPCGHIQPVQHSNVRSKGKPTCVICGDNHFTAPSNLYLSLVSNSEHGQFYKLGTSNDLKRRLSSQELRSSDDTKTEHLAIKPMDSKLVAMKDEKSIHRKFKKFRPFFNKCPDWYQDGGTELIEINEVTTGFFNEYFSK